MTYRRFEDLPVWNDALELALRLLQWTSAGELNGLGDLRSQIERAVVSISNNIAEGFERGTNNELLAFLYIARGSAGETRSMLHLVERLSEAGRFRPPVEDLLSRTESVSKQLGSWIESIKNSKFAGDRSRSFQTRKHEQDLKRRHQFEARLQAIQDEARSLDRGRAGHVSPPDADACP